VLWPHTRPWFVRNPQPMLRCIAEPERVGRLLAEAISAAPVRPVTRAADAAKPVPASTRPAPVSAKSGEARHAILH